MNAIRPVRMEAQPAVSFKAWRLVGSAPNFNAYPVELPAHIDDAEQAAQYALLHHKECVAVVRTDHAKRPEHRHLLSLYLIKRKSNPGYERGSDGKMRLKPAEYPDLISRVCVPTDEPFVEPYDAMADPVGIDRTLVEQGA